MDVDPEGAAGAVVPVTHLDAHTTRVLAPNPSLMTLEGTNTYLVGAPGTGEVCCVDPGPALPEHRAAIERAAAERDAQIVAVLLTHHHVDHAEAAAWAREWQAPLLAATPSLIGVEAAALSDGDVIDRGAGSLEVVETPGHSSDHVCFRVRETGAVLTGDHVLGRGTTVVAWPDGDMGRYLASLDRVAALDAPVLYPGHGPTVDRPREVLAYYISHRREREAEILAALEDGPRTPAEIVARVYVDVDPALHGTAERSVRAHLAHLLERGEVRAQGERFSR